MRSGYEPQRGALSSNNGSNHGATHAYDHDSDLERYEEFFFENFPSRVGRARKCQRSHFSLVTSQEGADT